MQENEIIERIKALCHARSWTFYRLAKESGLTYSTLCTMLHKANSPSIPTLIKLCEGFGISLSQFFDIDNDYAMLTIAEKEHLQQWKSLSKTNQATAEAYISFLLSRQQNSPK